jgi:outer membrane protein assembly factor BamB
VVLDGTTLYLVSVSGISGTVATQPKFTLVALDISDGKPLWQQVLKGIPTEVTAPALADGMLYLSEQPQQVFAVSPTGTPGAPGPTGIVPTSTIIARKASDGSVLWQTMAQSPGSTTSLLVTHGMVFYSYQGLGGPGGGIFALHAADGSAAWQLLTGQSQPEQLLAVDGAHAFAVSQTKSAIAVSPTLHAYDAATGVASFQKPFPTLPLQVFVAGKDGQAQVAGGTLYLVQEALPLATGTPTDEPQMETLVLALSATDGSAKWHRTLAGGTNGIFYTAP